MQNAQHMWMKYLFCLCLAALLTDLGCSRRGGRRVYSVTSDLDIDNAAKAQQTADPTLEEGVDDRAEGVNHERTRVTLTPLKSKWALGEPVYLYLTIHNRSTNNGSPIPLKIRSRLSYKADLALYYEGRGKPRTRYIPEPQKEDEIFPNYEISIPTNGYWEYILVVCRNAESENGFTFLSPGEYRLSGQIALQIYNEQMMLPIEPTTIRVTAPNERDKDILLQFPPQRTAEAFQQGDAIYEDVANFFRETVETHPDTVYYQAMQLCLARKAQYEIRYQDAVQRYESILQQPEQSVPPEPVYYDMASCYAGLGDVDQVYAYLRRIWKENPGNYLIDVKSKLFAKYFFSNEAANFSMSWELAQ